MADVFINRPFQFLKKQNARRVAGCCLHGAWVSRLNCAPLCLGRSRYAPFAGSKLLGYNARGYRIARPAAGGSSQKRKNEDQKRKDEAWRVLTKL